MGRHGEYFSTIHVRESRCRALAAWFENGTALPDAYGGKDVLVMGFSGWLAPAGWHGGLSPVSVVAFIGALVSLRPKLFSTVMTRSSLE